MLGGPESFGVLCGGIFLAFKMQTDQIKNNKMTGHQPKLFIRMGKGMGRPRQVSHKILLYIIFFMIYGGGKATGVEPSLEQNALFSRCGNQISNTGIVHSVLNSCQSVYRRLHQFLSSG